MKKLFATLMCLAVLSFMAVPTSAVTRYKRYGYGSTAAAQQQQRRANNTSDRVYRDYGRNNRSFWDKHRDKLTTAGGALGGAVLGGLIGGKRGAAIGAIGGGAGAGVYTYKVRNKDRRY